jgi:hypothetical protein
MGHVPSSLFVAGLAVAIFVNCTGECRKEPKIRKMHRLYLARYFGGAVPKAPYIHPSSYVECTTMARKLTRDGNGAWWYCCNLGFKS